MDKEAVLKAIYDLSDATTAREVHSILSRFKSPPMTAEQIDERLEDIIQEAIQGMLDLLKQIQRQEEKAAEVSGFDNNILNIDTEEEAPKTPEELAEWISRVSVPPPPGTIDPNATGIPDNSRKAVDPKLADQVTTPAPDQIPYIEERPYPFQVGDYVSWATSLGRSYGRIEDLRLNGALPIDDSPLEIIATHEDPVCLVRIWRNDGGQGWLAGDTVFPLKMSVLHKIDPLEPPTEIPASMPNSQKSKNLEAVILKKKLNVKAVGGQLRGSFKAIIKSVDESEPSSYTLSAEDTAHIGAEWIPEGSIVRDIVAADLLEDRGSERFLRKGLEDLALYYPGKPMLLDHEWSAHQIVGKVLSAKVRDGQLVLRSYFANTDKNKWVVDAIKSGMFTMVSVGFASSEDQMVCSACGKSIFDNSCKHQPGDTLKKGDRVNLLYEGVVDVFECSIIPVPMQPGAHILPASKQAGELFIESIEGVTNTLNSDMFKKGGLVKNIVPIAPADTIPLGTPTIGNSKLSDNLSGIVPIGTAGAEATVQDMGLNPQSPGILPGAAVDPPASGTLPDNTKADPDKEDPDKKKEAEAAAAVTSLDLNGIGKMVGEFRVCTEGMYGEMCNKMDSLAGKADDIHTKTSELLGTFKTASTPAPAPDMSGVEGMIKAFEAKLDSVLSQFEAQKKAVETIQAEQKVMLDGLHKKLDVAMTTSTEGVMKLLLEDNVPEQAPARSNAKKSLWINDYFGLKDDQGGQS